jgi:preprotein translocase subunit YajC
MQGLMSSPLFVLLPMFAIFYFLILRPQSKRQKEQQAMLQKLGKGDEVITRGGLIGKITGVGDDGVLVIELQEKVRVRMPRAYLEGRWDPKAPPASATKSAA